MRALASVSGTIGADGTVTVRLGPVPVGQAWDIDLLSVRLSTGTGTASIYSGDTATDAAYIDGTYDGGRDATSRIGRLDQGETIIVEWTGATVAATATATMRGIIRHANR